MIKLIDILREAMSIGDKGELNITKRPYNPDTTSRWALHVDNEEDWNIVANMLDRKGYKFAPGYTFSKYNLTDFNPFKSERVFGDEGEDDNDSGYSYAMSYKGVNDFILLDRPNKKLQIITPEYFNARQNSTYKNYKLYNNLSNIAGF
jgi:hypothetical protein